MTRRWWTEPVTLPLWQLLAWTFGSCLGSALAAHALWRWLS